MSDEMPKLGAHYKKRQDTLKNDDPLFQYEKEVDEYKKILNDKVHPKNRTAAYDINVKSVFNRLLVAADKLDEQEPGRGIFGLIILALRANLALKDKNLELEVQVRDLEKRMKKLEQR